jgi:hypothetical protein
MEGFQSVGSNQSGVSFFPESVPPCHSGVPVGGLGVSGDGVDQLDFVASGRSTGSEVPAAIRAYQVACVCPIWNFRRI